MKFLVVVAQQQPFDDELKLLRKNNPDYKIRSALSSLAAFIDADNVLKVGSLHQHASIDYIREHPILLSSKHRLTVLQFKQEHIWLLHPDTNLLLTSIKTKFWLLGGRNLEISCECIRCFHYRPKQVMPFISELPRTRLFPAPLFHVTGIYYAGPFILKDRSCRWLKTL